MANGGILQGDIFDKDIVTRLITLSCREDHDSKDTPRGIPIGKYAGEDYADNVARMGLVIRLFISLLQMLVVDLLHQMILVKMLLMTVIRRKLCYCKNKEYSKWPCCNIW